MRLTIVIVVGKSARAVVVVSEGSGEWQYVPDINDESRQGCGDESRDLKTFGVL